MKALYTTGPREYFLTDRPKPVPKPHEALIKVTRAGMCHTDVIIREGSGTFMRYPFIPGHEFAGVVEQCGSEVTSLVPGEHVAAHTLIACGQCSRCRRGDSMGCEDVRGGLGYSLDGGFAEYCAIPARFLFPLSASVSLEAGALVEPLANAVSAVGAADLRLGDRVVVIGPGPIGLLALQVALLEHPQTLLLIGTRDERLAVGESLGATHTVNIRREGARERAREEINRALGDKGADAVIVCTGTTSAFELAMDIVGWRGRVIMEGIGQAEEGIHINPNFLTDSAVSIIGVNGWVTAEFARAVHLLSFGLVQGDPIVTHTLPLVEWETAFDLITTRKSESLKVMLAP